MTARELVVKLVLNALGFKEQIQEAQKSLDKLGELAAEATQKAAQGMDTAADKARELDGNARQAGTAVQQAGERGQQGFAGLLGVLGKVALALGGLAAIQATVSNYVQTVGEVEKTADMLGMSMEAWQGWAYAAQQAGLEAEDLRDRMADLGDWMTDLNVNDSGPLKDFAEKTKTSFKDARGATVSMEEGLLRLADAAQKMDRQQATSWLVQIGLDEKTIPLVLKGRRAIEDFLRTGKEQALYSKRDAELARKMREAWQGVSNAFAAVSAAVLRVLGPAFTWLATTMRDVAQWARQNEKSLLVFLGALAAVVATAVVPALSGMAAAALAAVAPFAPLLAAIAGVALVIEDLVIWLDGGESALADFWAMFGTASEVSARLQAIWEGLKSAFWAVVQAAKAFLGIMGSLLTFNLDGLIDSLWSLLDAFSSLSKVLGKVVGWLGDKLKGLLPDWALSALGWDGSANAAASAARQGDPAVSAGFDAAASGGFGSPFGAGDVGRQPGAVNQTRNVTTSIGQITVQTQATDAQGIAGDIGNALRNQTAQADGAFGA